MIKLIKEFAPRWVPFRSTVSPSASSNERAAELQEKVQRWLLGRGIQYGQTWLIFGSAPDPVIPQISDSNYVLTTINNAGITARQLRLKRSDLMIRTEAKDWPTDPQLESDNLLWISSISKRRLMKKRRGWIDHEIGSIRTITSEDRDLLFEMQLSASDCLTGRRPSTSLLGVSVALTMKAQLVLIAGMSLREGGHSYDQMLLDRKHILEDKIALKALSKTYGNIFSVGANLAEDASIPEYKDIPNVSKDRVLYSAVKDNISTIDGQ